jgi:hypothetical protein
MLIDSPAAADLLYESEATLRMVDNVLDELRIGELEVRASAPRLKTLHHHFDEAGAPEAPPEFRQRAFWQVQELMDCVREGRRMLQTEGVSDPSFEQAERLGRIALILDRLDSIEEPEFDRKSDLFGQLRQEMRGLIDWKKPANLEDQRIAAAIVALSEAEGRLTRLGTLFDGGDPIF